MSPQPIGYADRVLAVGKNGSGKSVAVRWLFAHMTGARRVAIDPKAELELGVVPHTSPDAADWSAPILHFRPPTLEVEWFEDLYNWLWSAGGPATVWLDEAVACTTGNYAPRGLRLMLQQGRSKGVGHFACTQRPQRIAPELVSEADHIYVFTRALHPRDVDVLAAGMGMTPQELEQRRRELLQSEGDHSFLWFDRNADEILPVAPLPAEYVGVQLLPDPERNGGHAHHAGAELERQEPGQD